MAAQETATGLVPNPVRVTITFVASADTASIQVAPGRFQISKGRREQVEWACAQSGFIVDFGNDSPFQFNRFQLQTPGTILSGPVRPDLQPPGDNHIYKYTVTVGGSVLDPEGQVDK